MAYYETPTKEKTMSKKPANFDRSMTRLSKALMPVTFVFGVAHYTKKFVTENPKTTAIALSAVAAGTVAGSFKHLHNLETGTAK